MKSILTRLRDPLEAMTKTSCKQLMELAAAHIERLEADLLVSGARLDENHVHTAQMILDGISELPTVPDRLDGYMRGRGIEDPTAEIIALRKAVF